MKDKSMFILYVFTGLFVGTGVEFFNGLNDHAMGIGILVYITTMITYWIAKGDIHPQTK